MTSTTLMMTMTSSYVMTTSTMMPMISSTWTRRRRRHAIREGTWYWADRHSKTQPLWRQREAPVPQAAQGVYQLPKVWTDEASTVGLRLPSPSWWVHGRLDTHPSPRVQSSGRLTRGRTLIRFEVYINHESCGGGKPTWDWLQHC